MHYDEEDARMSALLGTLEGQWQIKPTLSAYCLLMIMS
jgi:hypothetical protein